MSIKPSTSRVFVLPSLAIRLGIVLVSTLILTIRQVGLESFSPIFWLLVGLRARVSYFELEE